MTFTQAQRLVLSSSLSMVLAGCGAPNYAPSEMHLTVEEVRSTAPKSPEAIPALVKATPTVPTLSNEPGSATFDVVVTNVPVRDLLFALARDAGVNMDVDSRVGGLITMSALDQTLDAILERIAQQVAIRVDRVGNAMVVKNDEPYFKRYHIDYTSVSRTYDSSASTSGVGDGGEASINNVSENSFWDDIETSIDNILGIYSIEREDEAAALAGAEAGENQLLTEAEERAARVAGDSDYDFNKSTGILVVFAPDRLQKEIEQYLNEAMSIAKRQVLLEITVVEVVLNNQHRQGIDWSVFNSLASEGLALYQGGVVGGAAAIANQITEEFEVSESAFINVDNIGALFAHPDYQRLANSGNVAGRITDFSIDREEVDDPNIPGDINGYEVTRDYTVTRINDLATNNRAGGLVPATSSVPGAAFTAAYRGTDVSAALELLDTFGDAKVLSSPRISVLNNQPALLRVIDQEVYFTIEAEETINEETGLPSSREYTVEENTVDVGFSMNVLPHITDSKEVFLNLKPSVTRVLDYRQVPSPTAVGGTTTDNLIPITRVRELESVMLLRDGEIAVMGGLLEDRTGDNNTSVPGLSELPGVGRLFERKNEQTFKTEFIVFIKASVITNPSLHGDYADYADLLPDSDFIIRDNANTALPPKQKKAR